MRLGCVSMCCLSAHEWAKSQFHQSCKHVCKTTPLKSWVHPLRAGIEPQTLARRCIANIKDECAHDYGGCWRGDYKVNGRAQTYHACKDNIQLYKVPCLAPLLCSHLF